MFQLGTKVVHMDTSNLTQRAVAGVVSAAISEAGKSQREVAQETGIPLVTLSRRLTGHSPFLITEIGAIAQVLDLRVSELISRAERVTADAA